MPGLSRTLAWARRTQAADLGAGGADFDVQLLALARLRLDDVFRAASPLTLHVPRSRRASILS